MWLFNDGSVRGIEWRSKKRSSGALNLLSLLSFPISPVKILVLLILKFKDVHQPEFLTKFLW